MTIDLGVQGHIYKILLKGKLNEEVKVIIDIKHL
tara:strand:+ start:443 stop:544 length:102 start_codon:yes stop_codon:yes gene_type:complete